jgi:hypothetical protein
MDDTQNNDIQPVHVVTIVETKLQLQEQGDRNNPVAQGH